MAILGGRKGRTERENERLVERFFTEFVNAGDAEAGREFLAEDYVRHDPSQGEIRGRESMLTFISEMRRAFPDASVAVDELFSADDRVVVLATERGTHQGTFMDVPATGKAVEVTGIVVHRVEDGRIAETWAQWDSLGMLRQLGILPESFEPREAGAAGETGGPGAEVDVDAPGGDAAIGEGTGGRTDHPPRDEDASDRPDPAM